MTNLDVISSWINRCPASSGNLSTNGTVLRSYGVGIAKLSGTTAWITTAKYGHTTSTHTNLAKRMADADGYDIQPATNPDALL